MKKKKYIWTLLTFMVVAMISVGITSCSKDSDDDGSGGDTNSALVGTWSRSYNTGDGKTATESWTFNQSSSGSYRNAYQTATFTYYDAQGYLYLKIKYNDMSSYVEDVKQYSISGQTLYLDGNKFTKQ